RTVKVSNLSLGASEQDILEFFSFSGVIQYVDMKSLDERSQTAFVTFKDAQSAETAVLLSGATIVDQSVTIALEPDYVLPSGALSASNNENSGGGGASSAVQKAEDIVSGMLAKGFVLGKDALNKAKSFDERHRLISTATATVASLDQKIGLTEKIAVVNERVREVDQRFQVSEKTKSAIAAAEQSVSSAGSAIMRNRYVLTGTAWAAGAFGRLNKAAEEIGRKTVVRLSDYEKK
ncbi:hypothetical protein M569_15611, partial [Genlisea aurea]